MVKQTIRITFTARLCLPLGEEGWTFIRMPQDASDQLPARSMVSVEGTMNGFPFAATLQPDNQGGHWLKVEPEWSNGARSKAGDEVEFELSPATVEPEPEVPEDLLAELRSVPTAWSAWMDTTAMARRDWITWMNQGRKPETRRIRMDKMMDMLSKGKRRVCCYDRSGMASKAFYVPVERV